MSDYFDQFELALRDAVARRAHLRWFARVWLPIRGHGLGIAIAVLVVATPAVAAVGAVSGWFSPGKPDVFYPAPSTSGLGKTTPGTRMLSIRVPDPGGGPPWGMRLVTTSRGDTCVQVGRVEYGEIGSLGIDYSWGNDHKFHPINPNDGVADVCGATDAAGYGFVSSSRYGWPASAYTPSDYGGGTASSYCQAASPEPSLRAQLNRFRKGSKARALFEKVLKREEGTFAQSHVHACPPGSLRMMFVGLLGPDARSITYKTPSGATETENTVGGVGAYLIVFKQTASNCDDYSRTLIGGSDGCGENYGGTDNPALRGPNAVISVTYDSGKTCSDQPSSSFAAAWEKFSAQSRRDRSETAKQARARFAKFLAAHHLTEKSWFQAVAPQCPPVGWVSAKQPKLTAAQVASPIKFTVIEAKRYCDNGPPGMADEGKTIGCDHGVPKGYRRFYVTPPGQNAPPEVLVTASFIASQPVTSTNSWYEWQIANPGNGGGGGNRTQTNIRRGQTVTFTMFEPANKTGTYHGIIAFMQTAGQSGPQGGDFPGHDGSLVVGRFSFKLPLTTQ